MCYKNIKIQKEKSKILKLLWNTSNKYGCYKQKKHMKEMV